MQTIKMDFQSQSTPPVVPVMQYDAQSRFIGITLYNGGVPYEAPEGASYTVEYCGPGANNSGWYDTIQLSSGTRKAVVVSSSSPNVVTLELAEQALRVNGEVKISLCVVNNTGYKLNTFPIICRVTGAPYVDPVSVRSYFYVTGLTSEQWMAYVTACQDAQKRAEDAAAKFVTDPTLSLSGKAADAKATGDAVGQLKEDLGDFSYTGKFQADSKYSTKDISTVPQKGDLIFFAANDCSSRFFVNANLFLYYTENDFDIISIKNVGDYKIFASQKNYIKATIGYALSQNDETTPTWKATLMSSDTYNLAGIIMLLYGILDSDNKTPDTGFEYLKNDLVSKGSRRFNVSKTRNNTYLNFDVNAGDKGFIFVTETNASNFTAYDLYWHEPTSDTFKLIEANISSTGEIHTYDNNNGYDYLRIIFKCSAPSTKDEYISCVFTNETDTDAFGLITKLFFDIKNMKESSTTAKINIPDAAKEDVLSTIAIKASNSKKNNIIGFEANFENMGSVRIAHGTSYDANRSASIIVDGTNIYLYDKSTNLRATYPHGLTMDKFITVSIVVGQTRTAKIILTTANGRFIQENAFWGGCREDVTAQAISGTFTNARLTWYVPDYNYDLWAFGDSYFDFWGWDIIENLGFHNFMFDGFGGRGSRGAFTSLNLALEKATPKKILWCLGMNDPDTENAIDAEWKETVDSIIELCNKKGIELILCTIPETPVTVHTFKNAYIKASGKRYVDVCHAVGADVSNTWYDGLRNNTESDKIHPTNLGTRVIADYMIANVPELCAN